MPLNLFHSFYRWIVLSVSTLVMIGIYGTELSFGVFLKPMLQDFEWTRAAASGALSLVMGVSGPIGILTGRLTDKYGSRVIIGIGALFAVLGYGMLYRVHSLWQLYIFFGLFLGISISSCWPPLIATVSRWFTEKRVLAIGILTSGLTIGSMFIPPLAAHTISLYGWRNTFLLLALIVAVTNCPALFFLGRHPGNESKNTDSPASKKTDNQAHPEKPMQIKDRTAIEAIKTLPFFILVIIGFVTATGFFFIAAHIVAYATDLGLPTTSAALILSFQSMGNIAGKLIVWPITSKIGSRFALILLVSLQAFVLLFLIWVSNLWGFFALAACFGFGLGGSMTLRMSMIPEFFGTQAVGMLVGIVGIAWGLGGIAGPVMAGLIFDITSSYTAAFFIGAIFLSFGVLAAFFLKSPQDNG